MVKISNKYVRGYVMSLTHLASENDDTIDISLVDVLQVLKRFLRRINVCYPSPSDRAIVLGHEMGPSGATE